MKGLADDNFKFDENGRKLSKRVENTVENHEISRHWHFFFFPQCFLKICTADTYKSWFVWKRINALPYNLFFNGPKLKKKLLENTVGR